VRIFPLATDRVTDSFRRDTMTDEQTRSEPQSLRASNVMASLTVKDLQASLEWYRDVVGFTQNEVFEQDGVPRAARMVAGDVRLLLNQDDGAKGWDRVKGEGFSLTLSTGQDVDAIAEGIRARGGTLVTEPADMPWGVRMFRLVDPDGYKLSISTPLSG
jgi:uncharacterized glyoxalase superfamily protein PhnB